MLFKILKKLLINLLIEFMFFVRPVLGNIGCCKFEVSCLNYAKSQLQTNNIFIAMFNVCKRLLVCI